MAKMMPTRIADGKGKGLKYPLLAIEVLKLTLKSMDGVAHVMLSDSQLEGLNSTFQYVERAATAPKPKARKRRGGGSVADERPIQQGLNRLDIVEKVVADIEQRLQDKAIKPKWATLQMVRSKLLEFILRQELLFG